MGIGLVTKRVLVSENGSKEFREFKISNNVGRGMGGGTGIWWFCDYPGPEKQKKEEPADGKFTHLSLRVEEARREGERERLEELRWRLRHGAPAPMRIDDLTI